MSCFLPVVFPYDKSLSFQTRSNGTLSFSVQNVKRKELKKTVAFSFILFYTVSIYQTFENRRKGMINGTGDRELRVQEFSAVL